MTCEEIEMRKVITQMLADVGINRETLKTLVHDVLNEKIDKSIKQIVEQETSTKDGRIRQVFDQEFQAMLNKHVSKELKRRMSSMFPNVTITLSNETPDTDPVAFCPKCGRKSHYVVDYRDENFPVLGEDTTIKSKVAVCKTCNHDIYVNELDDANLKRAFTVYCAKHGFENMQEARQSKAST